MEYPSKVLEKAVEEISALPGIGKRSALRLALFIIKRPELYGRNLAKAIEGLVTEIQYCKVCYNFSDEDVCDICSSPQRTEEILCVVEDVRDVMALENTGKFTGKYHILGGKISPLEGIGPSRLRIAELGKRLENGSVKEVIFALSAGMEGDTTAYYIHKQFQHLPVLFTSIARGIAVGDELEYADELSLGRSLQNRMPYDTKQ